MGLETRRLPQEGEAFQFLAIGSSDNLRMAVGRACRDAGVPTFGPHDLRHRRISLLHHDGETWAEIGARRCVGSTGPCAPLREPQNVSAEAAGSDARRKRSVRSVSRIAVKPTMTLTQVRVSFMPTLKARSAERDALPRRV